MRLVISMATFITTVLLIAGLSVAFRTLHNPEQKRIRSRLRMLSPEENRRKSIDIVRKRVLSEVPFLNDILLKAAWLPRLGRLLEQANSPYPLGAFLLLSILLGLIGFWVGSFVLSHVLFNLLGAASLGMAPFGYVYWQKRQRMLQFQRQLPNALDLVARALKAGHSVMVGMKMVGDEFPDPIGAEFDKTIAEINFGVGVPDALTNLARRVECVDLKFFVTSLIIQRETGGNLAEIIEKISRLIRQRFELQGRIRVLAAEGKLSAIVLLLLPCFVALALSFLNPEYLRVLLTDPLGQLMAGFGCLMILSGSLVIRMMIHIRV